MAVMVTHAVSKLATTETERMKGVWKEATVSQSSVLS